MKNVDAPQIDLTEFSRLHPYAYAVCDIHVYQYNENNIHGMIYQDGPWQCDNCREDEPAAIGHVYVVTE